MTRLMRCSGKITWETFLQGKTRVRWLQWTLTHKTLTVQTRRCYFTDLLKPTDEEHNHAEHGFPARVSLCCLCLALKKFQVAGFALQVWFEPSIVTGSFSNWGRNAFWLLVPNGGSPPVNTRGWALVQEQQFLNWCLLSFSDAHVCLLPLNATTTWALDGGGFISTSAYTKCWRKKKARLFLCLIFLITSPNDPLTICYYCGSCLETNRTDCEDLFPSHPVQGLLNC